jgi:hypothetical protein
MKRRHMRLHVAFKEEELMRIVKGAAIALALATTSLVTAGTANADPYYGNDSYRTDYGRYDPYNRFRYDRRHHRHHAVVSIQFGNVAIGYRDGYWDRDHRWHRWDNDRDYRDYRDHDGSNYHDWDHDRGRPY